MITNTNKPKILLVCEQFQTGEKAALGKAILEAGKLLGCDEAKLKKDLADDLIQEELAGKEFPSTYGVGTQGDLVGRILAVGIVAYNKVQIFQKDALIERVPQPRSWDDKMKADAAVAIARLLNGWGSSYTAFGSPHDRQAKIYPTQPVIPAQPKTSIPKAGIAAPPRAASSQPEMPGADPVAPKKKQPGFFDPPTEEEKAKAASLMCPTCKGKKQILSIYDRPGGPPGNTMVNCPTCNAAASPAISSAACPIPEKAFEADLEALEKMLRIEVSNNRLQACIFNWSKDGSTIEIKNAGITTKVALENLTAILVDDAVLKDEKKAKEVRENLDKAGYKNPYLMPIREFTMLVAMYQHLAKERKLVLELVA